MKNIKSKNQIWFKQMVKENKAEVLVENQMEYLMFEAFSSKNCPREFYRPNLRKNSIRWFQIMREVKKLPLILFMEHSNGKHLTSKTIENRDKSKPLFYYSGVLKFSLKEEAI